MKSLCCDTRLFFSINTENQINSEMDAIDQGFHSLVNIIKKDIAAHADKCDLLLATTFIRYKKFDIEAFKNRDYSSVVANGSKRSRAGVENRSDFLIML